MGIHPVEFEIEQQILARHIAGQARGLGAVLALAVGRAP